MKLLVVIDYTVILTEHGVLVLHVHRGVIALRCSSMLCHHIADHRYTVCGIHLPESRVIAPVLGIPLTMSVRMTTHSGRHTFVDKPSAVLLR